MWNTFRDTLINSTSKNIPHKTAKNKNGHPWIDAELKKQIRRQQRLYKKMKKTGDPDIKLTGNTNITYKNSPDKHIGDTSKES